MYKGKNRLLNNSRFLVIVKRLLIFCYWMAICWLNNQINWLIWKDKRLLFPWLFLRTRQHLNVTATFSKAQQYTTVSIIITIVMCWHALCLNRSKGLIDSARARGECNVSNPDYFLGIVHANTTLLYKYKNNNCVVSYDTIF